MDKRLKVNFVPFSNFGDTSVPYMLKKLNIPFIFTHHTVENKILMTGSILGVGNRKNTIVWGTGIIDNKTVPLKNSIYKAVRGYRTLDKLKEHGIDISNVALGDPAMLLSRIYKKENIEKKYKLGIIPHIVDYTFVSNYVNNNKDEFKNTIIIDPNTNVSKIEKFIDQVNECEKIVSTCLHGIICAHSYGIKASWMRVSDKLAGDDVKFYDHFESVGIFNLQPLSLIENEDVNVEDFSSKLDIDKLWNARPWIDLSDDYYVDIDDPNWVKECYFDGYDSKIWTDDYFKL
jgi:hypothetical protein